MWDYSHGCNRDGHDCTGGKGDGTNHTAAWGDGIDCIDALVNGNGIGTGRKLQHGGWMGRWQGTLTPPFR